MYALVSEATLAHGQLEPHSLTGVDISRFYHFSLKIWFRGDTGGRSRGGEIIDYLINETKIIHARCILSVTKVLVFSS